MRKQLVIISYVSFLLFAIFALCDFHSTSLLLVVTAIFSLIAGVQLCRLLSTYTLLGCRLKKALINGEIIPYYQPVINVLTGDIEGVEVLSRWKSPNLGFISPDLFIPIAEKTGLITPLTHALMQKVREDLTSNICHLPNSLHISINITSSQIINPLLIEECSFFLKAFNQIPVRLILEITEREPLEFTDKVLTCLKSLREMDVLLSLDDFGTGYSLLSCLNEGVFDIIKIDKTFVKTVTASSNPPLLLDCIIDMAKRLSLSIIVEGVETYFQADYLKEKGVHLLQGYYFYPPMPFQRFLELIMPQKTNAN